MPVYEGNILTNLVTHMQIGGRDLTQFVRREIGQVIPREDSFLAAKYIKERFGYVCSNINKEYAKYDQHPEKYVKRVGGIGSSTGEEWICEANYEQFLVGEALFHPEVCVSTLPRV